MESDLHDGLERPFAGDNGLLPEPPEPGDHAAWLELAERRRVEGDSPGERWAMERVIDLASRPATFDRRAILVAARRLTRLEAPESAAAAWRTVLSNDPHHLEARNQLAELELYDLPPGDRRFRMKLGVLGNCQAYGLADWLRRLYPDVEIRALSLGELAGPEEVDATAELYSGFDAVISQALGTRRGALTSASMAVSAKRYVLYPSIIFHGLHPDMVPPGAYPRGLHSRLVMAGLAMGLSQERVAELFNAYVYGVLGYFDAWAKAERHLLTTAAPYDFGLEASLPAWRADGAFMHTPAHPCIRVFSSIAGRVAASLELGPARADADPTDMLEPFGVWPVYPEIARRLGMTGDLTFRLQSLPPMSLQEMIAYEYAHSARLDEESLLASVGDVIAILRREGV